MAEAGGGDSPAAGPSGSASPAAGPSGAAGGSGRLTRSRARELGVRIANPSGGERKRKKEKAADPTKKRKAQADLAEPLMGPAQKKRSNNESSSSAAAAAAEGSSKGKEAAGAAAADAGEEEDPPLAFRPPYPPFPKSGSVDDMQMWVEECKRISMMPEPPGRKPFTLNREPIRLDAGVVPKQPDKDLVLNAALSVVGISSIRLEGEEKYTLSCSGIVINWDDTTKRATILTCSATVADDGLHHPLPQLLVHLPNGAIAEGKLLFFNEHYHIALLEIVADSPLQPATLGPCANYGQEIFVLARNGMLKASSGTVLYMEAPDDLMYNYYMSLSCALATGGNGGPVIDRNGNVIGMAFGRGPRPLMISISTVRICMDMWTKFGRVARPDLKMVLSSVEMLDVSLQEKFLLQHNISRGFTVDEVYNESIFNDIPVGDLIISFNGHGHHGSTLPEIEDFLLSLGWKFLESGDSSYTVDLELEVYDPVGCASRLVILPLGFSDDPEDVIVFD